LGDPFEGLSQEFGSFFHDGGVGVVEKLSERSLFSSLFHGTIIIECLCNKDGFAVGLGVEVGGGNSVHGRLLNQRGK
jgi:hypothetical protein